jgi:S-adenosyl methyltransferase
VTTTANDDGPKPATAARIYDYFLGGTHNFPADRQAAEALMAATPMIPKIARANRAFLQRAVRYMAAHGVRQYLDVGSGIPTAGNVHEVAPDARVVYVDIDPVAVAESLDILEGNPRATALRADLRDPLSILDHSEVRRLIDFRQPVGLLMIAMLHFLGDEHAYPAVSKLVTELAPGSYLAISHGSPSAQIGEAADLKAAESVMRARTASPLSPRSPADITRFFEELEFVEPGLVWVPQWRPAPDDPTDFADTPALAGVMAGVARRD